MVDAVVCGVGSGGTLTGLSRFFAKASPATEIVLADPVGSILADVRRDRQSAARPGRWAGRGDRRGFRAADRRPVAGPHGPTRSPTRESFAAARALLKEEGILAGSSIGHARWPPRCNIAASRREPKRVVSLVCDSGNKYLSKMFNDFWMADQGLCRGRAARRPARPDQPPPRRGRGGDGRAGRHARLAYSRMKLYDVCQLPVLENGRVVGIIDEVGSAAGGVREP